MSTYVLIHGSWHGAWCWYKLLPLLKRLGHDVVAPDLPGLGKDVKPLEQISLESWTERICEIVVSQPNPVVLVGHSRGGLVLSSVAEKCPGSVARLVYVTAGLLRDGESLRQLLVEDGTSLILPNLVMADGGKASMIKEQALKVYRYRPLAILFRTPAVGGMLAFSRS